MNIAQYGKAAVAIIGAVVTAVLTQFPDNAAVQQWGPIVAALLTAVSVYFVPYVPAAKADDERGMAVTELCLIVIAAGVVVYVLFGANLAR